MLTIHMNKLMPLYDKILLRKRSVIETINDELKNVAQLVHQVIAQLNPVTIIDESHNFDGSLNVTSLLGKVKPGSQVG